MQLPERVMVTEVGPRDGLQSFDRWVPTDHKVQIIEVLLDAGFRSIEVTSFVRPDVVPHLSDAEELMARLDRRDGVDYRALVPNRRGAERAVAAGVDTMVALLTVTDSYSRKNQNRSAFELLDAVADVLDVGQRTGTPVDVALAMSFFDPYEGPTPVSRVEEMVQRLWDHGARSFYVATSVGMADPRQVSGLCGRLLERWPDLDLGLHLHNTNGMALANALAAMDAGVRRLEGSICGIGGGIVMPHGMATVGNVPTEDLLQMLDTMGVDTGLEFERVAEASREIAAILGVDHTSFVGRGGTRSDVLHQGASRPRAHPA